MLRMMRVLEIVEAQVLRRLGQARVIALAEFEDAEQAEAAGAALLAGGCASVEVQCGHLAVLRAARAVEGLTVGAGNVRTGEDVELAVRAGAQFATATATNTEIVRACRELELPFFPGVTTPTEIERLALLGVRVMRVFPATPLGGPAYLQALAECYPELRFIPSGGIGPGRSGATCGSRPSSPSVSAGYSPRTSCVRRATAGSSGSRARRCAGRSRSSAPSPLIRRGWPAPPRA